MLVVHVNQSELVDDLVEDLRRRGCVAERDRESAVLVTIPKSLSAEGSSLELDLYLRAWEAKRAGARATQAGSR